MNKPPEAPEHPDTLFSEIKGLIQSARQRAAVAVNAELTLLHWQVGERINSEVLKGERANYGQEVVTGLSKRLTQAFGRGWSRRNLFQMIRFAELFPSLEIVQTLSAQLSWSHFTALISLEDSLKREFYLTMAIQERWSVRTLADRIDKLLFERTALSKKPELTITRELEILRSQGKLNEEMVLKDPWMVSDELKSQRPSLAKKAAAFFKMACSSFSLAFSLRKRFSSSYKCSSCLSALPDASGR